MQTRFFRAFAAAAVLAALTGAAEAQEWRGTGRVGGYVLDENKKPLAGVTVKAALPSSQNRGPEPSTSKDDGEWSVGGLSSGNWALDFVKEGYETRSISVPVRETSRLRPLEIIMTKKVVTVDPNAAINAKLVEAAALMNGGKFAEARAIYEALQTEHPDVKEFKPLIARAYYGEGNKDKAIELLRQASTADPANAEVRLLLGQLLNEAGKAEEARTVLGSVTDETVTDPVVFLNLGIGLINEGKHQEALPWFDKAVARFPDHPDSYYYRGLAHIGIGKMAEAKADLTKFIAIAKPDAPELAQAKAMLDSIK